MKAIYRVLNRHDKTVGFILEDNYFYNNNLIINFISNIDNLKIQSNNVIKGLKKLPTVYYSYVNKKEYSKLIKYNSFYRNIQSDLLKWKKEKNYLILQLEGARQVGKTKEVQKFGYSNYDLFIYVNLASDVHDFANLVLSNNISPLVMNEYCNRANLPEYEDSENTLLVIDEIQLNPKIYNLLRTVRENLNCDIIIISSYLGCIYNSAEFFLPAGSCEYLKLTPLSFEEFCKVFNKDKILKEIDLFGNSLEGDYFSLFKLYDVYRQIGGFPDVVKQYIKTKDIDKSLDVIASIM